MDFIGPIAFKICSQCGETKSLSGFSRKVDGRYGHNAACKVCLAASKAAYRLANPEKVAARAAAHYLANREKIAVRAAAHYLANLEKMAARGAAYRKSNPQRVADRKAAYRKANPEKLAAQGAAWRRANPEKAAASTAAYRKANTEKVAASGAAYYLANTGKVAAKQAAYCKANPEKEAAKTSLRRARKLQASPDWACQTAIQSVYRDAQTLSLVVDHLYPLKGKTVSGLHVAANLRPLCPKINRAKGNKLPGSLAHELWNPTGPDVHLEA